MDEKQVLVWLFVMYLFTVVGRVSYIFGRERGSREGYDLIMGILRSGKVWTVGDDGRLHQVGDDEMGESDAEVE